MKVTFFFNHTQEGEGCEIIYFAAVSLSQKMKMERMSILQMLQCLYSL